MSRNVSEIAFTLAVMVVIGLAVWDARVWEIKARLFPWAVGIPLLALLGALLMVQLTRLARKSPGEDSEKPRVDDAEAAQARRRGFAIIGWLLGFLALIWLIGFPLAGPLGTLAYLKFNAREKWPISLAISAGTAAFFALMIYGLNTPFPRGMLPELFDSFQLGLLAPER